MEIPSTSLLNPTDRTTAPEASGFDALSSENFFELIITDLLNQDPLEPTDNDKLLQQIAAIRDIEMNDQVTSTLRTLAGSLSLLSGQQEMGAAANLIGKYVESRIPLDAQAGTYVSGLVTGLSFDESGAPSLQVEGGRQIPLSQVHWVSSLDQAEDMIGKMVSASVSEGGIRRIVEGVATEVRRSSGQLMLELDSGYVVAFSDVRDWKDVE